MARPTRYLDRALVAAAQRAAANKHLRRLMATLSCGLSNTGFMAYRAVEGFSSTSIPLVSGMLLVCSCATALWANTDALILNKRLQQQSPNECLCHVIRPRGLFVSGMSAGFVISTISICSLIEASCVGQCILHVNSAAAVGCCAGSWCLLHHAYLISFRNMSLSRL